MYSLAAVDKLMARYVDAGGEIITVKEGSLGWGTTLCHGPGLKMAVITEVYLNEWSSGHKIRFYNTPPKKYLAMLERAEAL